MELAELVAMLTAVTKAQKAMIEAQQENIQVQAARIDRLEEAIRETR